MNAIVKDVRAKLMLALSEFATKLGNVSDEELPAAFKMVDDGRDLFIEVRERFRTRLLEYARENGEPVGEKGSMRAVIGDATVNAIKTRTGYEAKKVEAMLYRLGLDPATHMTATLTYTIDPVKLHKLAETGAITENDLKSCLYDPAWRVEVTANRES